MTYVHTQDVLDLTNPSEKSSTFMSSDESPGYLWLKRRKAFFPLEGKAS